MKAAMIVMLVCLLIACGASYADSRYCGEPRRDAHGRIIRSAAVIAEFKRLYQLPENLDPEEYQINHAVPLVCGGCDIVENMLWMHVKAKTCAEDYCQDRHEQLTMCPQSFHK